jgi:hypothetical protein
VPVLIRELKQLLAQLDGVAPRDPVAHRQRDDSSLQPRPERARGNLRGQLAGAPGAAVRAAHALAAMLAHMDRHRRQLLDLVARRLTGRDPVGLAEDVPARTGGRPVLDDVVDRPRRQQRPALALMPGLATRPAARPVLAALGRPGRILARRLRRVARAAPQPALQIGDALVLPGDTLAQPRDLLVHPQQHRHDHVPALLVDRLGLGALHTTEFAAPALCPPNH